MIALFGLMVLLNSPVMPQSPATACGMRNSETMSQTDKKEVPAGIFGGTGINLEILEEGATIVFDCAEAEITDKLFVDDTGNFTGRGTFTRRAPGPIRVGREPNRQPAEFEGKISGKIMTLTITLTDSDEEIGSYTLERDKIARIRRCM